MLASSFIRTGDIPMRLIQKVGLGLGLSAALVAGVG